MTWTARARIDVAAIHSTLTDDVLSPNLSHNRDGEDENRQFRITALELKRMVFHDLKDALEGREPRMATRNEDAPGDGARTSSRATWDEPAIHIQIEYPLDDNTSYEPPPLMKDSAESLWWLASVLNEEWGEKGRIINALQVMTRMATFVRRRGDIQPVVPLTFHDAFQAMGEHEKNLFIQSWLSPVSHGDAHHMDEPEGPEGLTFQPSLFVASEAGVFQSAVIFEVFPLLLDLDARRAFYTLKAGFQWKSDIGSPKQWNEKQREAMWTALFRSMDRLISYYSREIEELPGVEVVTLDEVSASNEGDISLISTPLGVEDGSKAGAVTERIVSKEEAEETVAPMTSGRKVFPLAFGKAPIDKTSLGIIQKTHKLTFPRKWSKIPRWNDLVQEEVKRILEEQGPRAFEDRSKGAGNKDKRGPILRKKYKPGSTEPIIELGEEARQALKARTGGKGYIATDEDGHEAFYKCLADSSGNLLEMWLSWNGLAGPFVQDWCNTIKDLVDEERKRIESMRLPLFEELDEKELDRLDGHLRNISLYERGRMVMEVILGQVGVQRRNPVELRADVFKDLLWPGQDAPKNWKRDVEAVLTSLSRVKFILRGGGIKAKGVFLASYVTDDEESAVPYRYVPRGGGGHGEGFFILEVSRAFMGCLAFYEEGATRLKSGADTVLLNYTKKLTAEEKKNVHGNFVQLDAGTAFYSAAAGLTPGQKNLMQFIEGQITSRSDGIAGSAYGPRGAEKVKKNHPEAKLARLYDKTFCPLLPEGKKFHAALGHFKSVAPESGFTLYGTKREARKNAGALPGGLIEKMGYFVPSGNAREERQRVVKQALEDLKAVAVEYLGGVVVGRLGEKDRDDGAKGVMWVPMDRFSELVEDKLCSRLKLYIFLPEDWNERRKNQWEEKTGKKVTESAEEAEAVAWGIRSAEKAESEWTGPGDVMASDGEAIGWADLGPLPNRLYAALKARNLQQKDLARIFGVSKMAVSKWLYGLKVGQNPAKALRIPDDLGALMVRWLMTKQEPTKEELDALPSRQNNPARKT